MNGWLAFILPLTGSVKPRPDKTTLSDEVEKRISSEWGWIYHCEVHPASDEEGTCGAMECFVDKWAACLLGGDEENISQICSFAGNYFGGQGFERRFCVEE